MSDGTTTLTSASVVVLGRFNPAIFSPAWLLRHGLISAGEADDATVEVILAHAAIFETAWLRCQVTDDRLQLVTGDPQEFDRLRDAAMGVLRILNQTPIGAMGINHDSHHVIENVDEWHNVGDLLVPKEGWEGVLRLPGMRSVVVEGVRPDHYMGYIRVSVQPSEVIVPGIFIEHNDHFVLDRVDDQPTTRDDFADRRFIRPRTIEPTAERIDVALEVLERGWHDSLKRAEAAIDSVLRLRSGRGAK